MPQGYRLSLEGLGRLIDRLAQAEDRMNSANKALLNAGIRGLGDSAVDDAGAAFKERWEYGTGKLAEAAGKMVEGLSATRKQYDDAEHNIAQYFPAAGDGTTAAPGESRIGRRMTGAQ